MVLAALLVSRANDRYHPGDIARDTVMHRDVLVSGAWCHSSSDMLHHRRHRSWEIATVCGLIESSRQLRESGAHLLLELCTSLVGGLLNSLGRLLGLFLELAGLLLEVRLGGPGGAGCGSRNCWWGLCNVCDIQAEDSL